MGKRPRNPDGADADTSSTAVAQDPPAKKPRTEGALSDRSLPNAQAKRTLFVRSLPAIATSEKLTELFSQDYPLKHATVVLDPETKQSKGYGFVTLADAEDAQRALDEFDGKPFLGRKMKIEIAQPRSREMAADGTGREGKKKSTISAEAARTKKERVQQMAEEKKPPKLIIRNLPWSVNTPEKLAELFKKFGKVKFSVVPKLKGDTQAGFGFITMRGKKNAEKAMASINGTLVDGRTLAVDWAVEKSVWETQKEAAEGDGSDDEDAGVKLAAKQKPKKAAAKPVVDEENEEDDVANFFKNFGDNLESEDGGEDESEDEDTAKDPDQEKKDADDDDDEVWEDDEPSESESETEAPTSRQKVFVTDNSTTLFIRNLPFTVRDPELKEHFEQFGPVRYARVVMDRATDRPRGTGFVCFYNVHDADTCFRNAPKHQPTGANAIAKTKRSVLENDAADTSGMYSLDGRLMLVSKAVEKETAVKLTEKGETMRLLADKDRRRLYLLSEGTVAKGTPLYDALSPSEVTLREDSAKQRKKLVQNNPMLSLSLTRLSIRNLPKNYTSKDLKTLAREAVIGFAKDVKAGLRQPLSSEEKNRGGKEMRDAEKVGKAKGKGVVHQAKIVFEGREGAKVPEESGAGKSRGYGFVEYSSHRLALMGLRWMNGHAVANENKGKKQRLIVEFAIENAQVVQRRKEKEDKARLRSLEVEKLREKGEAPPKEKHSLTRGAAMKKTRVGMKGKAGRPGKKGPRAIEEGKSFEKVDVSKPLRTSSDVGEAKTNKRAKKGGKQAEAKVFKPAFPPGEEGRLQRRAQIIQKKRQMRKMRKGGR